ncbi:Methyltransferase domain-containing protein [Octadecabacter temperatus]|uniref:Tellurite methyltransferase n=1 Tax=Octadecabacter temperatus TaxID=1458307 RepID=A0A0K0Y7E2_9RHOB|nr:class I SAM-dependent methyltransferase [Octadecabacter temperatus]AKS46801.1 Tellurite methyltransferase [Octadecabacter temperatus]SIO21511.1 Methyltransferase domain-containing protein [Octadecabacter temperatus]
MSYDYDKLYASEAHALGEQTAAIATFIAGLSFKSARILDVGCGQGRDALPLARAGHDVTGVDLSPSGVEAMCAEAAQDGLNITGHVADITEYTPDGAFDILLIDRTLHMLDAAPRAVTFLTLIACVAPSGWLIVADETSNLPAFKAALLADEVDWAIERCAKGMLFAQKGGT